MAAPSTIHRVAVELADVDRQLFTRLQARVARHPSETAERLVLRVLAWALCQSPDLAFTRGVSAGDEPDLWSHEPDGRVRLWVEVGQPDPERLVKAARHCRQVILVAGGANLWRWKEAHLERLETVPGLCVLAPDAELTARLAAGLERTIDWTLTVSGGTLYLTVGEETLEGTLEHLAGPPRDELEP
ncbi:MAG: hypothetical protein C0617_14110 [Desulfuromonas sp.]|uniref:YaeQ family protein n=1 Tax=Desulfuromonas sp. TaxID=892 RepID=UPI000CAC933A|nr:YaeQ family protein [Desulfuromonas sp.]PLX82261.1 MAG: hypothetical protein C0617_14110 [Desulfuromonas sp.]